MMRLKYNLCLVLMMVLTISGCKKEPINDTIEQHWKLERFTVKDTQDVVICERMFFGITRMVTEVAQKPVSDGIHDLNNSINKGTYVARTDYNDNETTLILRDFKVKSYNTDTKVDATSEQLKPFGIINPKETVFQIKESTHKKMVLESDYACLELSKF